MIAAFNCYLTLIEAERGEALNDKTKNALLFGLLRSEGLRQFGSDPIVARMDDTPPPTHTAFQAAVRQRFYRSPSISHACLDFANHRQGTNESAADFLATLRELAPECRFPATYLDRALTQQILVGCKLPKAREWMLVHVPEAEPNLDAFVKILDSDEAVTKDQQVFSSASGSGKPCGVASVVSHPRGRSKCSGTTSFQKGTEKGQGSGQAVKGKCRGCGSGNHRSYDGSCPAKGAECRFCHRLGHYESVCITKQKSQMASGHTDTHAGGGKSLKHIAPAMHAVSTSGLAETPFQTTVHLCGPNGQVHTVEGEVDMGSYCSIVSHRLFDSEF